MIQYSVSQWSCKMGICNLYTWSMINTVIASFEFSFLIFVFFSTQKVALQLISLKMECHWKYVYFYMQDNKAWHLLCKRHTTSVCTEDDYETSSTESQLIPADVVIAWYAGLPSLQRTACYKTIVWQVCQKIADKSL